MAKQVKFVKERKFSTVGTTSADGLADGIARPFTIVGLLTESEVTDTLNDFATKTVGNKQVSTVTTEKIVTPLYTLAVGLAITSPADQKLATEEQGLSIAEGKARKGKTLLTLSTSTKGYFTATEVKRILEDQAKKVSYNPGRFVKISAPKPSTEPVAQVKDKTIVTG